MKDFNSIWEEYYPKLRVYGSAFSGLSGSDIEDCIQEIFLKVHRYMNSYDPRFAFSTWLYRIARNTFIDFQRTAVRQNKNMFDSAIDFPCDTQLPDPTTQGFPSAPQAGHNSTALLDAKADIKEALKNLSQTQREIFHCFYSEQMKISEISTALNLNANTVKSQLLRGRKQIANILGDDYGHR